MGDDFEVVDFDALFEEELLVGVLTVLDEVLAGLEETDVCLPEVDGCTSLLLEFTFTGCRLDLLSDELSEIFVDVLRDEELVDEYLEEG